MPTMAKTHTPPADEVRMAPATAAAFEWRADGDTDNGTLVGYPVLFNAWTEIDSFWEGTFMERIAPTALNKTLADRGDQIKVLFNHGMDPTIGDKPLGKPAVMNATRKGLWTETPFADTTYNADLKELIRIGAIDGMSFRFSVVRDEWNDEPDATDDNPRALPERTIKELRLFEFGPVTFPAYEATSAGVRARPAYEAWLRDQQRSPKISFHTSDQTTAGYLTTVTVAGFDPSSAPPADRAPAYSRAARQQAVRQFRLKAGITHAPARTEPPG